MNKFLKYSPLILGGVIGIVMAIYDIPFSIDNIINIFLFSSVLFLIIYTIFLLYIKYKIKLFISNKEVDLNKLEKVISNFPNKQLKCYFMVNLSLGYSIKKDYKKALELLEWIDTSKQNSKMKVTYYNNMALFLYRSGKKEEAKKILEENKELFDKYLADTNVASILRDNIKEINNDK